VDVEDLGIRTLKNVPQPMRVYRIDSTDPLMKPTAPSH
jgi:hypothetical protein